MTQWIVCDLWTYWGDPKPLAASVQLPIAPQEGDDISFNGRRYTVMKRRIAHLEPLRLYVALEDEWDSDDIATQLPVKLRALPGSHA